MSCSDNTLLSCSGMGQHNKYCRCHNTIAPPIASPLVSWMDQLWIIPSRLEGQQHQQLVVQQSWMGDPCCLILQLKQMCWIYIYPVKQRVANTFSFWSSLLFIHLASLQAVDLMQRGEPGILYYKATFQSNKSNQPSYAKPTHCTNTQKQPFKIRLLLSIWSQLCRNNTPRNDMYNYMWPGKKEKGKR